MKKSTIRRANAQTSNQLTAANLNRVCGKIDARRVLNMDDETAADYLETNRRRVRALFKTMYEARTWCNIDAKAVRLYIAQLTADDIETAKTATGTIDAAKLVNKAIARAAAAARKEAAKEARKQATSEAKAARKEEKERDRAAEKAEKAASCWFVDAA